ncbi:MAG: hypothetical protein EBU90_03700 [Proteobacteria bacterium]|nr:hypothetical protein [Pseudomonadota bacterium]NBP13670.1 hypothetical protein [bacterium]
MSGDNKLKASEKLSEHLNLITAYIELGNTKFSSFREEYLLAANMSSEDLKKMTQQEAFDTAYLLYGYATYIQDEINKNKVALNWCNDQLEKLVVAHNEEFSQYTKHEVKRQIIIKNNNYAASVDHMREVAESRLIALDGKVYELKRKADILLEKGKRT